MKSVPYRGTTMFPPRPKTSIHPGKLDHYEKKEWIAQYKFNGTRNLIFIAPGGEIKLLTRHQRPHKQYMLTPTMRKSIESLATLDAYWYVLDSELMHNKTRGIKNTIVVFDILVYESKWLVGSRCEDRIGLLHRFLKVKPWKKDQPHEDVTGHHLATMIPNKQGEPMNNLWCIKTFRRDLKARYEDHIELKEIEGLVLKNPSGTLDWGTSEANNASWQVRCRKPTKNYTS